MATYESRRYNTPVPDAAKIADGSVNNTEFEHLDGVTSDIQTQINTKLNTTGGTITGNVTITDNDHLYIGDGQDIDILSDGTTGFIKGNDLRLQSSTGENYITTAINGATKLFHDNVLKAETTGSGLTVSGAMAATTLTGDGSGLTTLNASNLSSGTVPAARLPASSTGLGLNGGEFFTANGTCTCPTGVTKIFAIITGGGGGAGGQNSNSNNQYDNNTNSGRGGSGGNFEGVIAVTPGTTYNIVVGGGGQMGSNGQGLGQNPGSTGGSTTAFGITATGGAGGSGSYTGQTGGNPNGTFDGANGSASGTSVVAFRTRSRDEGAFCMQGIAGPTSATQSPNTQGPGPHTITGPNDEYGAGIGGNAGNNIGQAGSQNIKSGTSGNSGAVQIFF